jgi:hypothetical protein
MLLLFDHVFECHPYLIGLIVVTTLHVMLYIFLSTTLLIFVDGIESIDIKTVEADNAWSIAWPNVPPLSDFPGSPHLPLLGGVSLPPPLSLPILPPPPPPTPLPSVEGEPGSEVEGIMSQQPFERPDADHIIDGPAPTTPLAATAATIGTVSTPSSLAAPSFLTVVDETKSPTPFGKGFALDGTRSPSPLPLPTLTIAATVGAAPMGGVPSSPPSLQPLAAALGGSSSSNGSGIYGDSFGEEHNDQHADASPSLSFSVLLAQNSKPFVLPSTSIPVPVVEPVIQSSSIASVPSSSKPSSPLPIHAAAAGAMTLPAGIPTAPTFGITRQRAAFFSADDTTDSCTICSLPFNTLRRRHHCRHCGMSIISYRSIHCPSCHISWYAISMLIDRFN